jgi:hypothetical protein
MLDDVEGHRWGLLRGNAQLATAARFAPRLRMPDADVRAVLDEIARGARRRYQLIERFQAGENRSTWLVGDGAQRFVLKLDAPERLAMHERAARACGYLAGRGYPAPRTIAQGVASGQAYTLRTRLPGAQLSPEDGRHVDRLIELVELHAGAGAAANVDAGDWPASVVDPVRHSGAGFCLLETMRAHSDETAQLLTRLQGPRRGRPIVAAGGGRHPPL